MATPRGILNSLFNNFTAHLLNPVLKHLNNETPAYQLSHPAHVSKKVLETTSQYLSNVFSNLSNSTSAPSVCTPAAYHEFPPDLFTSYQRSHGAMVVHLIVIVYMFVALSIVCDDFFVTSLDKICEKLGFSEDVAGATFMAAGSSAPELFTSIIGVFITKGDVGVGTIVGSAVFNVLFVIGICALCSGQVVPLSWWPLCRDSIFYSFSVVILILVVIDGKVTWYESLMMLFLYVLYIVLMRFNQNVQAWVNSKVRKAESTELLAINGTALKDLGKSFQGDYEMFNNDEDEVFSRETARQQQPDQPVDEYIKAHNKQMTVPELVFRLLMLPNFHCKSRFRAAVRLVILCRTRLPNRMAQQRRQKFQSAAQQLSIVSYTKSARSWFSMTYEGENFDQWKVVSHPRDGVFLFLRWLISYPIHVVLYFTVPDSRKSRWEKWFMVTFLMSIFWIAIFSYIMVWMVTLIGFTLRIPDSVMGITFLAAGTSIPDAMASVFVVKQGQGDMAVSNSVGSNVFDILLGLAFPWFLMTGLVFPGSTVQINSNGMVYSIILLFLTVISTISVIYFAGWCLNKTVGITCLVVYAIYLVFSVMIECNQFGYVNPPMCVA